MKRLNKLLIIPFAVLILYHPVIFTYFSQDDFFHFKVSLTDGSFNQLINLLGFHPFSERGIAFYRPIFRELLFNISYSLFGLSSYPLRVLQFFLLISNAFLVYILIKKIFKEKGLAFFVALFFSICSAQTATLYYLAGGVQVLGSTLFILLYLILWHEYITLKKIRYKMFSFLAFLFALGSHELSVIIPFLTIGLSIIALGVRKTISFYKYFFLLLLVLLTYLLLDIRIIGYSSSEQQYSITLNVKALLNSYFWYSGWALGLPEMLVDFVFPGFRLNPSLMKYWGNFYRVIFPSFFISTILLLYSLLYLGIKNKGISSKGLFFSFWFLLSLFPVILLPLHKSSQYLEPGLPAFWTVIGLILFRTYSLMKNNLLLSRVYIITGIVSLLILSTTSIFLQRTTFWAAERGRLAEKLINQVKKTYPSLPKGAIIYFKNDPTHPYVAKDWGSSSKQAALVLNNDDALQLIYKDQTLKVYYEDLDKPPTYLNSRLIEITATIY